MFQQTENEAEPTPQAIENFAPSEFCPNDKTEDQAMAMQNKDLQLFGVLRALVERVNDKDDQVRASVGLCLRNIARDKPDEVLQTICTYRKSAKMPTFEVARLLTLAESVCRNLNVDRVDVDTSVHALVDLALQEMTHSPELLPEWQLPASQLLVAIGRNFCDKVMEALIVKVQPGVLPHYFVVHTLGSLAAANPLKMVPHLKPLLSAHISLLGGIRSDAMKQGYSYSLARFADAISEYLANIDQTVDQSVTLDTFSAEMDIAFNTLAHTWLPEARETQLRDQVLHAVSSMLPLLPRGRVETTAPILLSGLMGSRRRRAPLSLAAVRCLESVISHPEVRSWPPLEQIVAALTELVLDAPDLEQPLTIKSHYEALRCFHTIDKRFPDKLSAHLVQQVKNGNEKDKATALVILSHLASAGHSSHLSTLVTVVSSLVDDPSLKVKRAAVKVIVVLAHKEVLHTSEGGRAFLFIVNNCRLGGASEEAAELRQTCRDSLLLVSGMATQATSVLAPLLLRCFLDADYSSVAGLLARCLAQLQHREPLERTKSADVLARCLVLLGAPFPEVGVFALQLIRAVASTEAFDAPVAEVLQTGADKLIEALQDVGWSATTWETVLLGFMKEVAKAASDPVWAADLAVAVTKLGRLNLSPEDRNAQLSCLVSLAVYRKDAALATTLIQEALAAAKHPGCHQICASALGRCAGMEGEGHLQLTLAQLKVASKDLPSQKTSGASKYVPSFFSNFSGDKSKSIEMTERLRAAILLSYGEIASRIPGSIALLESSNVLEWMLDQAFSAKDKMVLESAHVALNKIFESGPGLSCRDEALSVVMSQLRTGGIFALKCVSSLITLPPPLDSGTQMKVLRDILSFVIDENPEDSGLCATLLSVSRACLLGTGVNPASLDLIVTLVEPMVRSEFALKRTIATMVLETVLQTYADNLQPGYECPSSFCMATSLLALCVPRCTDVDGQCRRSGVECVRLVLEINSFYLGESQRKTCEQLRCHFDPQFVDKLANDNDPDTLFRCSTLIAEAVIEYLGNNQVNSFAEAAIAALVDPEVGGAAGLTVVLSDLLKEKGHELYHQVQGLINLYVKIYGLLSSESVRTGFVVGIGNLAQHHPKAVAAALLNCPLPFPDACLSLWRLIAKDEELANEVLGSLLCQLASNPLLEEPRDERSPRVARVLPLSIVSSLGVMLSCDNSVIQGLSKSAFAELLSSLLVALAAYVGACPPVNIVRKESKAKGAAFVPNRDAYALVPGRVALESCQALLSATGLSNLAQSLNSCRVDIGENLDTYMKSVQLLVREIVAVRGSVVQPLVTVLVQNATSPEESTRIAVVTVLAELVQWSGCSAVLLESLVQQLTSSLDDENTAVRQLCLQGLSRVSKAAPHLRERYTCPVLVALLQGLEDSPGEGRAAGLAREALAGLALIIPHVPAEQLGGLQSSLALRVLPFVTKESELVRAAAFRVLVQLICSAGRHGGDAFLEQLPSVMLNLLLGLSDTNEHIFQDCQLGLQGLQMVLESDGFTDAMAKTTGDGDYGSAFRALVPWVGLEHPEWVEPLLTGACGFTKSVRPATRACAVALVAALAPLGEHERLNAVCALLTKLLSDPCNKVRAAAAIAISHLFTIQPI